MKFNSPTLTLGIALQLGCLPDPTATPADTGIGADEGGSDATDADGDGYDADVDCDDADATIHPDAEETWYDGIDSDCAGDNDFDADADGFGSDEWTDEGDCDDASKDVNPDAEEICGNDVDENCSGSWDCAPVGEWDPNDASVVFEGNSASAYFGEALALVGDLNEDGISEVIVGAPGYTGVAGDGEQGSAFLFVSPFGPTQESTSAWLRVYSASAQSLGSAVAGGADLNLDGSPDFVIGAPNANDSGSCKPQGGIYLYLGGLEEHQGNELTTGASLAVFGPCDTSDGTGYSIGSSLDMRGDANGDGHGDLLVGSEGPVVYVALAAAGSDGYDFSTNGIALSISGWQKGPALPRYLGDITGTGRSAVAIGMSGHEVTNLQDGAVYVFDAPLEDDVIVDPSKGILGSGKQELGTSLSPAGDYNGDGYMDVLIGAGSTFTGTGGEGAAYVVLGGVKELSGDIDDLAYASFYANSYSSYLGWEVGRAGDMNDDGFGDVLISSPYASTGGPSSGAVWLQYGPDSGAMSFPNEGTGNLALFSGDKEDELGTAMHGGADLDADGLRDLLVGAPSWADGDEDYTGRVLLFSGTAD